MSKSSDRWDEIALALIWGSGLIFLLLTLLSLVRYGL